MIGKILVKGMLAGFLAGMLLFSFMKVYGEPLVDRAIGFEEQESTVAGMPHEPELVSREVQASVGLFTGVLVYSAAVGGLFSIAFAFAYGRVGGLNARNLILLLAVVGFVALIAVPALKYPANPPAVGNSDTISARTELYFLMMGGSLFAATAAMVFYRWLKISANGLNAGLAATLCYIAVVTLMYVALPTVSEVPDGFPADMLWNFRIVSLVGHLIFWGALGVGFAFLQGKAEDRDATKRVTAVV